jgi:outer membrane protein OmpA-like peptidoglycan-associated protein
MRLHWVFAAAGLAFLAGCASQPSGPPAKVSVVVLPKPPQGQVGAVVVRPLRGGEPVVLNEAYVQASLDDAKTVQTTDIDARQVKNSFSEALSALPPQPVSFIVYFSEGADELNPDAGRIIDRAIAETSSRASADVMVIGHTDFLGSDAYNDRLSLQRAERVKALLIERGLPPRFIQVSGRGKREPQLRTAGNVAEPRNRRVEITVR